MASCSLGLVCRPRLNLNSRCGAESMRASGGSGDGEHVGPTYREGFSFSTTRVAHVQPFLVSPYGYRRAIRCGSAILAWLFRLEWIQSLDNHDQPFSTPHSILRRRYPAITKPGPRRPLCLIIARTRAHTAAQTAAPPSGPTEVPITSIKRSR